MYSKIEFIKLLGTGVGLSKKCAKGGLCKPLFELPEVILLPPPLQARGVKLCKTSEILKSLS